MPDLAPKIYSADAATDLQEQMRTFFAVNGIPDAEAYVESYELVGGSGTSGREVADFGATTPLTGVYGIIVSCTTTVGGLFLLYNTVPAGDIGISGAGAINLPVDMVCVPVEPINATDNKRVFSLRFLATEGSYRYAAFVSRTAGGTTGGLNATARILQRGTDLVDRLAVTAVVADV